MKKDYIPILLTATVNPQGMKGANFDPEERLKMYVEALEFYAKKGLKVVFAENSGWLTTDVKEMGVFANQVKELQDNPNVEFVDVSDGCLTEEDSEMRRNAQKICYDQSRGKGYNETILIHKAVLLSKLIKKAGCFFKITGRLKVLNVEKLLDEVLTAGIRRNDRLSGQRFLADCKDHKVYEWLHMPINGHAGECRYWFASVEFFESMMWPRYKELNDFSMPPVLAEDLMLDVCRKTRSMAGCRDRFRTQARISGKGGHKLGNGLSFFYSTDNDSFALKAKCGIRQVLRWLIPWWKV